MPHMFVPRVLFAPLFALLIAAVPRPAAAAVLPWIEDDYGRAMAMGRERQLPVFVESWAPW